MSLTGYNPSAELVLAFPQGRTSVLGCFALLLKMTGICIAQVDGAAGTWVVWTGSVAGRVRSGALPWLTFYLHKSSCNSCCLPGCDPVTELR